MARAKTAFILAALLAGAFLAAPASAIEIGVAGATSNLFFPWDDTAALPPATSRFPVNSYFLGGNAWVALPLGEEAALKVSYERDPVLRNSIVASVLFERGIAKISAGPLIGFLNSPGSRFSAGLSAAVSLRWPGVAYASMRSDGGLAISLLQMGADPQAQTTIAAGFYVPNAIVSGVVAAKRFNEGSGASLITDALTSYALTIDMYKKNVPFTLLASVGYEQRAKRFAATGLTDTLGSVVIGGRATAQFGEGIEVAADFSSGVYVVGLDNLRVRGPSSSAMIFSAGLGFILDFEALRTRSLAARAAAAARKAEAEDKKESATAKTGELASAAPADLVSADLEVPPPVGAANSKPRADPPLSLNWGMGLGYNATTLPPGGLGILAALFNLRGGGWIDLLYLPAARFGLGGEAGLYYMTFQSGADTSNLIDAMINAKASLRLGKIKAEAFVGAMARAAAGSGVAGGFDMTWALDAGGRASLGGFYAEGSYILGLGGSSSYPRFGLGFSAPLKIGASRK
jgi:hypothetical protein